MSTRVIQGDCVEAMRGMEAGSVQCCVTSPPYWALRKYAGEQERVWGGDAACEHEWGDERVVRAEEWGSGPGRMNDTESEHRAPRADGRILTTQRSQGVFCRQCGAWRGALGLEPTPDLYVEHIVEVFRGVRRVLRDDGTLWLNMGDGYSAASTHGGGNKAGPLDSVASLKAAKGQTQQFVDSAKPKDLLGMPWRVAFALQADGWWLRSAIVWAKGLSFCEQYAGSVMPESARDRPTSACEMVFLLTKNGAKPLYWTHRDGRGTRIKPKPDYRWQHAATGEERPDKPHTNPVVKCPVCRGKGGVFAVYDFMGETGTWHDRSVQCPVCHDKKRTRLWRRINLWSGSAYFYDWFAAREAAGQTASCRARYQYAASTGGRAVGDSMAAPSGPARGYDHFGPGTRNWRNVWAINPEPYAKAHFATYPTALASACITAGTSPKACAHCGAPWERVVEREVGIQHSSAPETRYQAASGGHSRSRKPADFMEQKQSTREWTTGFQPTCECEPDDSGRCVVLDPFGGSGTTGLAAKRLGRDAVLIELSDEYCELARERCAEQVTEPLFA